LIVINNLCEVGDSKSILYLYPTFWRRALISNRVYSLRSCRKAIPASNVRNEFSNSLDNTTSIGNVYITVQVVIKKAHDCFVN
jgi:hypothetical protein